MLQISILNNFFSKINIYSEFIKNNKKHFKLKTYNTNKKILVELFDFSPSYISFSYFSNVLKEMKKANIVFYTPNFYSNYQKIKQKISNSLVYSNLKLARSFGCTDYIYPKLIKNSQSDKIYNKILKGINSKEDILKIKIYSIPIGELIYDEYLFKYNVGTINIKEEKFIHYLEHAIKLFLFWYNRLKKKEIKALIVSHTCYFMGLPARIAVYKDIPCYCIGPAFAYYLTKKNKLRFSNFKDFPKLYKKIPKKISKKSLKISKKIIIEDFLGKNVNKNLVNYYWKKKKKIGNQRINILIAAHCFTDAVHIHGSDRIFCDFFEWINFLGKISNRTNYNWYIKLHPSQYSNNYDKMISYINKYPKLKLLSQKTKNLELLNKIDYVLTVYGTVAREYPLFNIPVLNASHDGPHCGYNFSYNFSLLKNYENALLNIKKYKVKKKSLQSIPEFYSVRYMSQYYFFGFFKNRELMRELKNGNIKIFDFIQHWNEKFNEKNHKKILLETESFIKSKKVQFTASNINNYSEYLRI